MSSTRANAVTTWPAIFVGNLPDNLPYADAVQNFKPLGVLIKQDDHHDRTLPYGFLCAADHATATRLYQQLLTRDYRFEGRQIRPGHVRDFVITKQQVTNVIKTGMQTPLEDWHQALVDLQTAMEAYYGYQVYISNITIRASIS